MTFRFETDDPSWYPHQRTGYASSESLAPNQIVIWECSAYRVIEIRERSQPDWPDAYRDRWEDLGTPDPATWYGRPFTVTLRLEQDPDAKPLHLLVHASYPWDTLPEHYSICRVCREIPPCTHVHNQAVMAAATKKLDAEMSIIPGLCHACLEPITRRQKSITFEGENLMRPDLGDSTAIFHLRTSCRAQAERYDARWAAAGQGRRRKLFCAGRRRYHYDGTVDCTEGQRCPGDVGHESSEWHTPDGAAARYTSGCWCVSGDLTARRTAEQAPFDH